MSNLIEQRITDVLPRLGLDADARQVELLTRFVAELERWNKAYNLTAVRDPLEMVTLHIADSLSVSPWITGDRVLDVGTGGGLPGIPLAIMAPRRHYDLLDTNGKKTRFVTHAALTLKLPQVEAVHARVAEHRAEPGYDTIVSRAFSSLADFVTGAGHLLAPGGRLVAMKGRRPDDELREVPPGWQTVEIASLDVPGLDAERHVVILTAD